MVTIYTIGYAGRSVQKFIDVLKKHGIEVVVDVRRFPKSKYQGFCREDLEKILADSNIEYVYLGDYLGGFRRGGYERFMKSSKFKAGIKRVVELARSKKIVLMCRERSYKWCHRRHVALALENMGFEVVHI